MAVLSSDTTLTIPKLSPFEQQKANQWVWPSSEDHASFAKDEPSLEEAIIAWGTSQCKISAVTASGTGIDVLCLSRPGPVWHPDVCDDDIHEKMKFDQSTDDKESVRVCFINTLPAVSGRLPGNFSIRGATIAALRKAGISPLLLSNIFTESSYWAKMGNQCLVSRDDEDKINGLELCYQYRFGWSRPETVSYIHSKHDERGAIYFCINFPPNAFATLSAIIRQSKDAARREMFVDSLAAEASLKQWQNDLGSIRTRLMAKERIYNGPLNNTDFDLETRDLHQLSKEWLAMREDLVAFCAQLNVLSDAYSKLHTSIHRSNASQEKNNHDSNPFQMLISQAEICSRWAVVYRERTDICIQMLFHFSNQKIAESSRVIAEQTRRDSASMITIAAVTMLFLPGTFICAVLSTTFFDFGKQDLEVSSRWWVLLATTLPMTAIVFGFWYWWRGQGFPRHALPNGQGVFFGHGGRRSL